MYCNYELYNIHNIKYYEIRKESEQFNPNKNRWKYIVKIRIEINEIKIRKSVKSANPNAGFQKDQSIWQISG